MFEPFQIQSWAKVHHDCALRFYLAGEEREAVFVFGSDEFDLAFDVDALGDFLKLGAEAVQQLATASGSDPVPDVPIVSEHGGGSPCVIGRDTEVVDRLTAQRWLLDLAGELWPLLELHQVDNWGRCSVCRSASDWRSPWPKRIACTVRAKLPASLRRLDRVALGITTGHQGEGVAVGGSSITRSP